MAELPKRFPDREQIADVPQSRRTRVDPGTEGDGAHRIAGRVMARRDMGKLVFLDLVDRSGRDPAARPARTASVEVDLALGDVIGVAGRPGEAEQRRAEPRRRTAPAPGEEHEASCRTRSTASPTSRDALPPAPPRPPDERGDAPRGLRHPLEPGREPGSAATSIPRASWRSKPLFCSRCMVARSPSRSSRTRMSWSATCTCGSPPSSI